MTNYSNLCIIIPAFNEEASVGNVISKVKKVSKKLKIVVINDGSGDDTEKEALKAGCNDVINLPFNMGIGTSVQTGLIYAKEHGALYAIQIDADGQHNPRDIPNLIKGLKKANLVIGSRFVKPTHYKIPVLRLIGMKTYSLLIYWTSGFKIYDSTSGYKAFDKKIINFLTQNNFNETSDLLWLPILLKNGYKIKEVPVEMEKRTTGRSSFKPFQTLYLMISLSISILLETLKPGKNE